VLDPTSAIYPLNRAQAYLNLQKYVRCGAGGAQARPGGACRPQTGLTLFTSLLGARLAGSRMQNAIVRGRSSSTEATQRLGSGGPSPDVSSQTSRLPLEVRVFSLGAQ
jgi:hypothetical protein